MYLGVAGWQLSAGDHHLLVDPYVSRRPLGEPAVPLVPDEAAIARYLPAQADAILVGHSHFDHLLDVPLEARRAGARVIGTASTARVARAAGVPDDHIVIVRGGETLQAGVFSVQVVRGLHSRIEAPQGKIAPNPTLPMPAASYAEGGTLQYLVRVAGRSVFFVGSANFEESAVTGLRPDVALVAIGMRERVPDYTCRLLDALGRPARVFANHFDDFTRPFGPQPPSAPEIPEGARADADRFLGEVRACAPGTVAAIPSYFSPVVL
jgi:L-ascorbate metabolism protein UlaG (beta-lactamase superfamily)